MARIFSAICATGDGSVLDIEQCESGLEFAAYNATEDGSAILSPSDEARLLKLLTERAYTAFLKRAKDAAEYTKNNCLENK